MSFEVLQQATTSRGVIRVNLLPAEIELARQGRRVRAALAGGLVLVAAACAGAFVVSAGHVAEAQDKLSVEQAKTSALQAAQRPYAEVPRVLAEVKTVRAAQDAVSTNDVPFYSYLDKLAAGAPDKLSLTSITFNLTAPGQAATSSNPLVDAGIGTVAVTGKTIDQDHVASWLESVDGIPGLGGSWLSTSSYDPATSVVTYTATGTVSSSAAVGGSQ
ncbi:PilN domain-containing protein [Kineococcus sp. DHX-1]|uniref:PilN domain-containing protein n=1 Tax=Kineococcus sp. DHX-1 TaxID=3349638 RepID=UPI0036D438CD